MKEKKQMKKGGVWRIIYPYLTIYGVNIIVSIVASMIFVAGAIGEKGLDYFTDLTTNETKLTELMEQLTLFITENNNIFELFIAALAVPILVIFMRMDKKRLYREGEYVTYAAPEPLSLLAPLLLGAFSAITFNNLINISGLMELYYSDYESVAEAIYSGGIVLEVIAVVIVAPVMEEMCFRGLIYRRCREVMSVIPAMIISSLLFGYFHGNLVQAVYAFGIGMLCAFIMERYQSLWACVFMHMGANAVSVLLSETDILDGINTNTAVIIYMAVFAVAAVLVLAYIHDKVEPVVLIPAGKAAASGDADGSESEENASCGD